MSEHTPGPWEWITTDDNKINLKNMDGIGVLEIYESHGGGHFPNPANANLIEAAPETLEALKGLLSYVDGTGTLSQVSEARDAIAKAEGRS